jgi:hypothetical protein
MSAETSRASGNLAPGTASPPLWDLRATARAQAFASAFS